MVVFDEGFGGTPGDHRRWLYTAITRAERGLWIYASPTIFARTFVQIPGLPQTVGVRRDRR